MGISLFFLLPDLKAIINLCDTHLSYLSSFCNGVRIPTGLKTFQWTSAHSGPMKRITYLFISLVLCTIKITSKHG